MNKYFHQNRTYSNKTFSTIPKRKKGIPFAGLSQSSQFDKQIVIDYWLKMYKLFFYSNVCAEQKRYNFAFGCFCTNKRLKQTSKQIIKKQQWKKGKKEIFWRIIISVNDLLISWQIRKNVSHLFLFFALPFSSFVFCSRLVRLVESLSRTHASHKF